MCSSDLDPGFTGTDTFTYTVCMPSAPGPHDVPGSALLITGPTSLTDLGDPAYSQRYGHPVAFVRFVPTASGSLTISVPTTAGAPVYIGLEDSAGTELGGDYSESGATLVVSADVIAGRSYLLLIASLGDPSKIGRAHV